MPDSGAGVHLYNRGDILQFLGEVDRILVGRAMKPISVIVIGGSGIALMYDPRHGTRDIDTFGPVDRIFREACRDVNSSLPRSVPVDYVGIADGPIGFEERVIAVESNFQNLRVYVPEAHDLILMKIVRGDERDIDGIRAIARAVSIVPHLLVSRYIQEMSHCIGDNRRLRLNFLDAYAALFGVAEAKKIERSIHAHGAVEPSRLDRKPPL